MSKLKYKKGDKVTVQVDSRFSMDAVIVECPAARWGPPVDQTMYRVELPSGDIVLFSESEMEPREDSGNDKLFFQKVILDSEHSLDITVYRRDPETISMSPSGTSDYSDREVIEADMSRSRAAALIDALMGAVKCVAAQKESA